MSFAAVDLKKYEYPPAKFYKNYPISKTPQSGEAL